MISKNNTNFYIKVLLYEDLIQNIKAFDFLIFEFKNCIVSYNIITCTCSVYKKYPLNSEKQDIKQIICGENILFLNLINEVAHSDGEDYQVWQFQKSQKTIYLNTIQELYKNLIPF